MPKYINKLSNPIFFGNVSFLPNQETQTYDTIDNRAFSIGSVIETFAIVGAVNDQLLIRFNNESAWTTITLTAGAARTAAQIATDINTGYGLTVAVDEGGYIRINAPINNNIISAVYIASTGSTAAVTLGLTVDDVNPISLVAIQAFRLSSNAETYNITSANNTFIFKVNNSRNWITATLTVGATQSAADIAADINLAYEVATGNTDKIALADEPITGSGNVYVKLIAPIYNNYESKLYIKSTGNTSLVVLGFSGDNFEPISQFSYPSLDKTSDLPLYNPIISETILTFAAAGTKHYYLSDADKCKYLQIIRATIGAAFDFSCYIDSTLNTPPVTIKADETFTFNLSNKRVAKLIITAGAAGNLTIRELLG